MPSVTLVLNQEGAAQDKALSVTISKEGDVSYNEDVPELFWPVLSAIRFEANVLKAETDSLFKKPPFEKSDTLAKEIKEIFKLDKRRAATLLANKYGIPYVRELVKVLGADGKIEGVVAKQNPKRIPTFGAYQMHLEFDVSNEETEDWLRASVFDNHQNPKCFALSETETFEVAVRSVLEEEARIQRLGLPDESCDILRANPFLIEKCEEANRLGSEKGLFVGRLMALGQDSEGNLEHLCLLFYPKGGNPSADKDVGAIVYNRDKGFMKSFTDHKVYGTAMQDILDGTKVSSNDEQPKYPSKKTKGLGSEPRP